MEIVVTLLAERIYISIRDSVKKCEYYRIFLIASLTKSPFEFLHEYSQGVAALVLWQIRPPESQIIKNDHVVAMLEVPKYVRLSDHDVEVFKSSFYRRTPELVFLLLFILHEELIHFNFFDVYIFLLLKEHFREYRKIFPSCIVVEDVLYKDKPGLFQRF